MRKLLFLLTIAAALIGFGCDKTGVPTEFSNACSLENDYKILEVEGFLTDGGGVSCSNSTGPMKCSLKLMAAPGDEKRMNVYLEMGTWANEMEKLSDGYKAEDIKVHGDDGNLVKLGEKLKITGELRAADANTCWINVTKITR
jgi:hypothetical protein